MHASGSQRSRFTADPSSIFPVIEDEVKDVKRVLSHGQEEDLKSALNMTISRIGELSSLLKEAYKTQNELETSLNLAKSNLTLISSNNEMLEEALKRESSGNARDVGWRRRSAREGEHIHDGHPRSSVEHDRAPPHSGASAHSPTSPPHTPPSSFAAPNPNSGLFKFRFTGSSSTLPLSSSRSPAGSRPVTPSGALSPQLNGSHVALHPSPSLPSLGSNLHKEVEELSGLLQRERAARSKVTKEKAALEAEIESLSQALFEEANKMVATERIKRAQTEEDLKEARQEKEALRSALRLIEGENTHLRSHSASVAGSETSDSPILSSATISATDLSSNTGHTTPSAHRSHSRTSSEEAIKSPPQSPKSRPDSLVRTRPSSPQSAIRASFDASLIPLPHTPALHSQSAPSPYAEYMPTRVDTPENINHSERNVWA